MFNLFKNTKCNSNKIEVSNDMENNITSTETEMPKENNLLYENEFEILECENYQNNIEKILQVCKEDMELYDGLSKSEIKEELDSYADEVGEIDSQDTPEIELCLNQTKTGSDISVKMYHKEFDKYLTIGKIPKQYEEEIMQYINKNILIWGTFIGGKFKTLDDDKVITINKPISIKILIKIFEH